MEIPIKLGAFYGLRRSEILGLRWSAIDFRADTLTIQHTVTACNVDGKHLEVASDTTKTKSSMRTLPLVDSFRELLLKAAGTGSLPQALRAFLLHQIPGLHLRQ